MKNTLLVPQLRCPLQSADGDVRLLGSGDAASVTYNLVDAPSTTTASQTPR